MSGCSMPGNCRAEDFIGGYFSVENQLNPFAPSVGIHAVSAAVPEVFAFTKNRQAGEQEMRVNSQSLRSGSLIFVDPLIEMRTFSAIANESRQGVGTLNL
jgi:hypothetical protein